MEGRLLLHFTLPLSSALLTRGTATLEVGDPEYYVAFSLPSIEAVRLVDAPAACRLTVHPGEEPDAARSSSSPRSVLTSATFHPSCRRCRGH